MSSLADILFLGVLVGLFITIFWKVLGGSHNGHRGPNAANRDAQTDYVAAQPHQVRRGRGRSDGDGSNDGDGGGGDGGGGGD
ncbi:MAG: hypothetical protein ABL908_14935 [Hyphomicrobium sp.]